LLGLAKAFGVVFVLHSLIYIGCFFFGWLVEIWDGVEDGLGAYRAKRRMVEISGKGMFCNRHLKQKVFTAISMHLIMGAS
jgi:hypothetical protein